MLQHLRTLELFASLDLPALRTVARHATLVQLPAGRRLGKSRRLLCGDYYLLSGRLKDSSSGRIVIPDAKPVLHSSRSKAACATAGHIPLTTLTPVRLLHIDVEPIAFLLDPDTDQLLSEYSDEDSWQSRFLRSHMLAPLPFDHWQKILGGLEPRDYLADEWVFRQGDRAEQCFVVAHGHGRIVRDNVRLRSLGPGDFFGEDALFSGSGRNACVQMTSPGRLMLLDAQTFHGWLADLLVAGVGLEHMHSNQRVQNLIVHSMIGLRERVQILDPCSHYLVEGDRESSRLAVLLLRQRGIRAELAHADTVRSFAQARNAPIDSPRITDIG